MEIVEINGIPVLADKRDRSRGRVRINVKKRKKLKDLGLSRLDPRQKQALSNYLASGCNPAMKKQSGMDAGYAESSALQAMNRLTGRKPIVKALEDKGVTDVRIAEVMAEGLEATHPLSKDNKKDYKAIVKFVSEANKVKGNYPPTKIQSEGKQVVLHITPEDVRSNEEVDKIRGKHAPDPF